MNRSTAWLAALVVAAGCATAPSPEPLPAWYADPARSPHPDCPPSRFLVEAASSPHGRFDAEARARAAVARRISSAIAVETERVAQLARADGEDRSSRSLKQVIREQADFRHAELIRIAGAPAQRGDEAWALACLDREEALEVLRREMEASLARFESAAARARAAIATKDAPGFTQAFTESVSLEPELLPRLAQMRAIAAEPPAEERAVAAAVRELHLEAGRIRGDAIIRLQLRAADVPADLRDAVLESFRAAVSDLGLRAVVTRDGACAPGSHLVRVDVEPSCRWGSLGHACRPKFAVEGEACDSHRVAFQAGFDDLTQGTDAREIERALRKALGRIDREKLKGKLRDLLGAEFPLVES